mmetsp:Transcript_54946/g.145701  ORF Transcript_54946/g.145701 Transcript_54946/m.145701 type:complete len:563 (+) Transcript_54946:131-1819(+)
MPMRITLLRKNLLLVFRALSSRRTSSISCALTPQQQPTSAIDRTSAPTLQTWPRTHARRRPHASTRPEPAPCARSSLLLVARERVGAELATADGAEVGNDALELGRRERGLLQDEAAESRHRGPVRVDGAADERRVGDGLDEPRLAGAGARLDEDAHQLDLVIEQVLRRDGGEARDALAQQPRAVLLEAAKGRLAERAGGLSATHEKTEESEHRARVLELLVADTADARLEERRRARQLQQQPRLKDEASVVHLPKRRQQLRLRLGVRCRVDPCARGLDEAAHDGGERVAHVIIGGVAAVHLDGLRDARETADDGGGREGLAHLHQQRRQQRREQLLERGHRGAVEVAERLHHVVLRAKHLGGRLQQRPDGLQHRQQRVALRLERVAEFDRRGDELQLRRHQGGRVGGGRRAAAPAGEPKRLQPRPQRSIGPRRHLAAHLAAAAAAASVASAAFAASLAALVATTVAPRSARRRSAPHEAASPRREVAPQPRLAATVATATTTIASAAPVAGRCRVRARRQRRARRAARELQAVCDGRTQQPSRLRPAAHARARQQRRIHLV